MAKKRSKSVTPAKKTVAAKATPKITKRSNTKVAKTIPKKSKTSKKPAKPTGRAITAKSARGPAKTTAK